MQERLPISKLDKKEISKIAYFFVRENYGTIPSIGEPMLQDNVWKIPINANYPRLLFNDLKKQPDRIRFMSFKDLAMLELSDEGVIKYRPPYYEIVGTIQKKLKQVKKSVEKANLKKGASSHR